MDNVDILLSIIIVFLLVGTSFYLGFRCAKNKYIYDTVIDLLERLEREGHVRTKMDNDGEKSLVLISQIVAEALEKDREERYSR